MIVDLLWGMVIGIVIGYALGYLQAKVNQLKNGGK